MEEPLIFTQQTVSIQVCVPVWGLKTEVLHYIMLFFFMTSGNLQPQSIVKSLVPSLNTLVLFEVSPVSFHQVGRCWFLTAYEPRYTLVRRACICLWGCRGFDEGQVSSVSEWLVPRPILRASTSPRGCPRSTEPTFTQRCKFELTLATMGFNHTLVETY